MQQRQSTDLLKVNLHSHEGLNAEDKVELQQLGYGSVKSLMDLADQTGADFTQISTAAIVIDRTQSDRIGEWLLSHPQVPEKWKEKWVSTPATAAQAMEKSKVAKENVTSGLGEFFHGLTFGIFEKKEK